MSDHVIDDIPLRDLVGFAELRVTIAEIRRQSAAYDARLDLDLSKSELRIGTVLIATSMGSTLSSVLSPARTPTEIARELPGFFVGPENKLAAEGRRTFMSGLQGIKAIVRDPIGRPIVLR